MRVFAVWVMLFLVGCGSSELFGRYDVPEDPETETAPWPRLVEVPEPPAPGEYRSDLPDPARGLATEVSLGSVAKAAALRAEALNQPVLTEAERQRLRRARE